MLASKFAIDWSLSLSLANGLDSDQHSGRKYIAHNDVLARKGLVNQTVSFGSA